MDYLVIVRTGWVFPADEFKRQLFQRWPAVRLEEIRNPDDNDALTFEIPKTRRGLHGALSRDGKAVVFSGELEDCAEFAQWCRSLIAADQEVLFCDEAMNTSLILELGMAPEAIVQAVVASYGQGR
ncbi:hypothetical protein KYC5002_42740 [Archangium violaceum]|uniref:hypothetical protein n=1 Tax=Archangium violaceum TaxID=83451 RepID=UPI002B2F2E85|nr:hypothetical protein KYC5002_42740 [Archangium gephyra]